MPLDSLATSPMLRILLIMVIITHSNLSCNICNVFACKDKVVLSFRISTLVET